MKFPQYILGCISIVGLLCACCGGMIWAKPAGRIDTHGHSSDMVQVLGVPLEIAENRDRMQVLTKVFAECIDGRADASALNRKLKDLVPAFTQSRYSHRLFFHWGFNRDPEQVEALKCCIEASTQDVGIRNRMWELIRHSQSERNRRMTDAVQALGSLTRQEVNALSALLYDTHLLGDYIQGSEKTIQVLVDLKSLKIDIAQSAWRLGHGHQHLQNRFERELEVICEDIQPYNEKAEGMLACMKHYIPRIIASYPRLTKIIYGI